MYPTSARAEGGRTALIFRKEEAMKNKLSVCLLAFSLLFSGILARNSNAADVLLSWYASTESDLAGYRIYFGSASGVYGAPIDVGNVTIHKLSGLTTGTWYFAITAYNSSGLESGYSNEVIATVTDAGPMISAVSVSGVT